LEQVGLELEIGARTPAAMDESKIIATIIIIVIWTENLHSDESKMNIL
jgi:hypothetical protein